MERFFFLDDADRELIESKRRAHNRLGCVRLLPLLALFSLSPT
ncbi:DUF4158 domain-containing protein [Streptomyces sp. NPDC002131]|nr:MULTISPECIES: DUF4158 domain-containing protein [unclassified Streptomyces]MCX4912071.1 DUF4158 domain-containing protein [Streptomyces sp. NBC_00687]MCX5136495.1 DUF4158 domain-containing protein [Streptomyces sp. NBC_00340]WSD82173.1 DUF4158 domain-containing protein [Streptomyces sp. NBC_01558]